MVKLCPSILSAPPLGLKEALHRLRETDIIHLDMMDGHFVPNLTFGPWLAGAVKEETPLPIEAHLMVTNPEAHFGALKAAGCFRVYVHAEVALHLHRLIHEIKNMGMEAGVALNPATPVESVSPILGEADALLIMSVDPGWGGQAFWEGAPEKIRRARDLGFRGALEVDGGIDPATAPLVVRSGADHLVAGSYLFSGDKDVEGRVKALRTAANS